MQAMIESPLGYLTIITDNQGTVTEIAFEHLVSGLGEQREEFSSPAKLEPELQPAFNQLQAYFDGTQKDFTFNWDLSAQGTPFQQAVWEVIAAIPYGEVMSYKEIAETLGKPRAYRAVANACGRNPLPIVVPCHRVVGSGSNGTYTLGGYSSGLDRKRFLMDLEKIEL